LNGGIGLRFENPEHVAPFHFYLDINDYTGISAASYEDLLISIKKVKAKSLGFHVGRGDFEKWVRDTFKDENLAKRIGKLRKQKLRGQALRNRFHRIVSERLEELKAKHH
jgi:hypothetical protein